MMEHYVYVYCDPRKKGKYQYDGVNYIFEYEPFYVGCGKGYRWKRHINQSSLNKKYNTIKNGKLKHIIENGYNPLEYVIFYKTNLSKTESLSIEKEIIKNIGRIGNENGILSNMNDGGADTICGFSLSSKGKSYDEIYGKRKSQYLKNIRREKFIGNNYGSLTKGKSKSENTKLKMSASKSKKLKQMDFNFNIINIWDNAIIASKTLGISKSGIHNVLGNNKAISSGGYYWEYVDKPNKKYKIVNSPSF